MENRGGRRRDAGHRHERSQQGDTGPERAGLPAARRRGRCRRRPRRRGPGAGDGAHRQRRRRSRRRRHRLRADQRRLPRDRPPRHPPPADPGRGDGDARPPHRAAQPPGAAHVAGALPPAYANEVQSHTALLVIHAEGIDRINESHGREIGDELPWPWSPGPAPAYWTRIRCSGPAAPTSPWSVPTSAGTHAAEELAETIMGLLANPYEVDGERLRVPVCMGLAVAGGRPTNADDMLRDAEVATYRATTTGAGVLVRFEQSLVEALTPATAEHRLRTALERGDFQVTYLPVFSLTTGEVVEVEALLRWIDEGRGMVGARRVPHRHGTDRDHRARRLLGRPRGVPSGHLLGPDVPRPPPRAGDGQPLPPPAPAGGLQRAGRHRPRRCRHRPHPGHPRGQRAQPGRPARGPLVGPAPHQGPRGRGLARRSRRGQLVPGHAPPLPAGPGQDRPQLHRDGDGFRRGHRRGPSPDGAVPGAGHRHRGQGRAGSGPGRATVPARRRPCPGPLLQRAGQPGPDRRADLRRPHPVRPRPRSALRPARRW